jgi:hypothetical protein
MVGTWFLQPCRPFTKPTENRRRQSDKCENLGKKADPPTRPIVSRNASCAHKCCHAWRQQHCKKSILRQRIYAVQARCATEAVSQTNRSDEDLDRSAGMNHVIEATGTPTCRSKRTIPDKDASMRAGQSLVRTNVNRDAKITQPSHSGHTVCRFPIRALWSRGAMYDKRRRDKPGQRWLDECAESSEWKASVRACFPFRHTLRAEHDVYELPIVSSVCPQCCDSLVTEGDWVRIVQQYKRIRCPNTLLAINFREVVVRGSCRTRRFHAKCPTARILSSWRCCNNRRRLGIG